MVSVMKVEKAPLESYADIGGLDAQIQEIKEAVELHLIHPELYEDIGIKPPKGAILYGEPGTRKNLLAKFSSSPPSPSLPSGARGVTPIACSSRSSPSQYWGCSINYYPLIQPQRNRKVRAIIEDEEDRTNVVLFDRHAQTILRQPVDSTKEMFQQVLLSEDPLGRSVLTLDEKCKCCKCNSVTTRQHAVVEALWLPIIENSLCIHSCILWSKMKKAQNIMKTTSSTSQATFPISLSNIGSMKAK